MFLKCCLGGQSQLSRECLFTCPPLGKAPLTLGSKKRLSPFREKSLDLCRDLRDRNVLVLCPSAPFLHSECVCPWRKGTLRCCLSVRLCYCSCTWQSFAPQCMSLSPTWPQSKSSQDLLLSCADCANAALSITLSIVPLLMP